MTWNEAKAAALGQLREAYLLEVDRFAEELRPRFESGELRAESGDDPWDAPKGSGPQEKLEALAAAHFGLEVTVKETERWTEYEGDEVAIHAILAVSPHASAMDVGDWNHVGYHAAAAVGWDLIALARARGWYTLSREEHEDPIISRSLCPDCAHIVGAHEEKGCLAHRGGKRCRCARSHVPHVPGWVSASA